MPNLFLMDKSIYKKEKEFWGFYNQAKNISFSLKAVVIFFCDSIMVMISGVDDIIKWQHST